MKEVHAELSGNLRIEACARRDDQRSRNFVSERLVAVLVHNTAIAGLPNATMAKRKRGIPTSDDLVNRQFAREGLNEL
jgi:hypothetical protein